ncbi:hypothetical protein [Conexibacter sp. SYSU D00693]|uniref:hypothetical protein n=1 Tax=Conexibacter sp. SYSU D00693 TaxID=2812560 RepID=UPI00196B48B3|nr:hypothetical protein [Conexibacter sp. SYSU D00693]
MTARRRLLLATAVVAAAAPLAGCGVDTAEDGEPTAVSRERARESAQATQRRRDAQRRSTQPLPGRPPGVVEVASAVGDESLTAGHAAAASSPRVTVSRTAPERAYADLCAGRVDLAEVTTEPDTTIFEACGLRDLRVEQPIQLAADALVLATRSERDIGGDCITVGQAHDALRPGSTIRSWSQFGFEDVPLYVTGREDGTAAFDLLGFELLGRPNASLADVRSDYVVRGSDVRLRREVTSEARVAEATARSRRHLRELRRSRRDARDAAVRRAERAADRRALAAIQEANRRRVRAGRSVADPEALEARNAATVERAKRAARQAAAARFDAALVREAQAFYERALRAAERPGTLGALRWATYQRFTEQLRPMEVDFGVAQDPSGRPVRVGDLSGADQRRIIGHTPDPVADAAALRRPLRPAPDGGLPARRTAAGREVLAGPSCVFPSEQTISAGTYPLARRTFLVTTDRGLRRGEVRRFLDAFVPTLQGAARERGLVAITDRQEAQALATVHGRTLDQQIRIAEGARGVEPASGAGSGRGTTPAAAGAPATTTPAAVEPAPESAIPGVSARPGLPRP